MLYPFFILLNEQMYRLALSRYFEIPDFLFEHDNLLNVMEEPSIDLRTFINLIHREAELNRVANVEDVFRRRYPKAGYDARPPFNAFILREGIGIKQILSIRAKTVASCLQRPEGFLERLFKRTAKGHCFTDRFHLHTKCAVDAFEFLKIPPRDFHNGVIDRRFERRRCFLRYVVGNFVEGIADRPRASDNIL